MFILTKHIIQRMIGGKLDKFTIAETVQTTVAAIDRKEIAIVIQDAYKRRAHSLEFLIGTPLGFDKVINGIQPFHHCFVKVAGMQLLWDIMKIEL